MSTSTDNARMLLAFLVACAISGCSINRLPPTPLFLQAEQDGARFLVASEQAAAEVSTLETGDGRFPTAGLTQVTRYRVVKIDYVAAARLLEFAIASPRKLNQEFQLSLFPDAPCTLSRDVRAEPSRSDGGTWRIETECKEDEDSEVIAYIEGVTGAARFFYRNICRNDGPQYRLTALEGTEYALAAEWHLELTEGMMRVLLCV